MFAAMEGQTEVVKILLDIGEARIDLQDNDGNTALTYAVNYDHDKVVDLLISRALHKHAREGNLNEVDRLTSTPEGKANIDAGDSVRN